MPHVRRTEVWAELGKLACRRAGVDPATPRMADKSPEARDEKDGLYAEYRRRLADTGGWTLKAVAEWLHGLGLLEGLKVRSVMSKVHRDRRRVLARRRKLQIDAERSREFAKGLEGLDEAELAGAARKLVVQRFLEVLSGLPPEASEVVEVSEFLRLAEALAKLSTGGAAARLAEERLREAREAAKGAVEEAAADTPDGTLSREDVYRILDEQMKGAA